MRRIEKELLFWMLKLEETRMRVFYSLSVQTRSSVYQQSLLNRLWFWRLHLSIVQSID